MREFQDSCQLYAAVTDITLPTRWTTKNGSFIYLQPTAGRRGGQAIQLSSNTQWVRKLLGSLHTELYYAFAYRFGAMLGMSFAIAVDSAGANQLDLRALADGTLQLTRDGTELARTAPGFIAPETQRQFQWYVKIGDSPDGISEVRLDGSSVATLAVSGVGTKATAVNGVQGLQLSGASLVSSDAHYICDVAINSTAGSRNNSWPGDARVDGNKSNGPGANNGWTPSAGERYECIDELPVNTTDHIESSTPGEICTVQFPALTGGPVQAVSAVMYGQKTDAGGRQVAPVFHDGISRVGTPVSLTDSYGMPTQIYELNPATGLPWAEGYAPDAGVKLVA